MPRQAQARDVNVMPRMSPVLTLRGSMLRPKGVAQGQTTDVSRALPLSHIEAQRLVNIPPSAATEWDSLAGIYRTKPLTDKSRDASPHVRLHTNFQHHKIGLLKLLGLLPSSAASSSSDAEQVAKVTRKQVQDAMLQWDGEEFEARAREGGMCATMYRTSGEWRESEQGQAVRRWLDEDGGVPFRITRLGESSADRKVAQDAKSSSIAQASAPARRKPSGGAAQRRSPLGRTSHLDALRTLDLSRVLAGPIAARTLAAHGAQVLQVSSCTLPSLPLAELDTARGKRCARVELDTQQGCETLKELIKEADVILQAYRREFRAVHFY